MDGPRATGKAEEASQFTPRFTPPRSSGAFRCFPAFPCGAVLLGSPTNISFVPQRVPRQPGHPLLTSSPGCCRNPRYLPGVCLVSRRQSCPTSTTAVSHVWELRSEDQKGVCKTNIPLTLCMDIERTKKTCALWLGILVFHSPKVPSLLGPSILTAPIRDVFRRTGCWKGGCSVDQH